MALEKKVDQRKGEPRRDDDRWLRDMIRELLLTHDRRLRKLLASVAVGYMILLVGVGVALYELEHRDTNRTRSAERVARSAAIASCERVNVLRGQMNDAAEGTWATLYISASREEKLADIGPQRVTHLRSARALRFVSRFMRFTNPTDCKSAVDDPKHYKPPRPQPFSPVSDPLLRKLVKLVGRAA